MAKKPVEDRRAMLHLVDGAFVYAAHHLHEPDHPVHTHSFFELAVVTGGRGIHHSPGGDRELRVGDVMVLRPGAWHGYERCTALDVFNCCFSADLMRHELAWTREDRLLGYLLWTGPNAGERRGMLSTHLDDDGLAESVGYLERIEAIRQLPMTERRGELVGWLSLFLSRVARAAGGDTSAGAVSPHPAVVAAMRLMEAEPARQWSLGDLSAELHLAPGYLVRLFKSATGLPPMAYLSRHRVELAAERLLRTDQSIARIGEAVGWPDPNYFARRFKSHYGFSASAYRSRFTRR